MGWRWVGEARQTLRCKVACQWTAKTHLWKVDEAGWIWAETPSPVYVPMSHWTSLTKQKFIGKIVKNFKVVTAVCEIPSRGLSEHWVLYNCPGLTFMKLNLARERENSEATEKKKKKTRAIKNDVKEASGRSSKRDGEVSRAIARAKCGRKKDGPFQYDWTDDCWDPFQCSGVGSSQITGMAERMGSEEVETKVVDLFKKLAYKFRGNSRTLSSKRV